MGEIELKLNISRLDLILVSSVVLIAIIVFIGFVVWLVKSSRQNRALKSIDMRLAQGVKVEDTNIDDKGNSHTLREYIYIDKCGNKAVKREQIKKVEDDEVESLGKDGENAEMHLEENFPNNLDEMAKAEALREEVFTEFEEEVDVMAEIQKMLKSTESYQMPKLNLEDYNVGKSGKAYTREDIENIIKD